VAAKKKRLVLTDPRAIRALAHPARQRIIDELYSGRVLTATECAELSGLTPSATSYHLRALARWGIIERADASADGRERPWRAVAGSLMISSPPGVTGRAIIQNNINRLLEQFDDFRDDDPWEALGVLHRGQIWLNHAETEAFGKELLELVNRYGKGRTASNHPADARHVSSLVAVVPLGKAPDEPEADVQDRPRPKR
jgi:DNA-binding transcriptional ArsR family regulator